MTRSGLLLILIAMLAPVHVTGAQETPSPFFTGGATAFDPVIGVIASGSLTEVQAAVTPDRKYVTLNMQASNPRLLALRQFSVQTQTSLGFVGGVNFAAANASPSVSGSILTRPGMTRLAPP